MKLSLLALSAIGTGVYAGFPYCMPGDECFPSDAELSEFNTSVDGRLIKVEPYAAACYKATYDAAQCLELGKKKSNYSMRLNTPGALIYPNWEADEENNGCTIPELPADGSAPPAIDRECTLGGMSSYFVNVTGPDHISKAVQFAAKFNLRLRVKNSGHDYSGRSSGPGTFAIWTYYLKDTKFIPEFDPCSDGDVEEAVEAGPGVNVGELYAFGGQIGRTFHAGYTPSVGAAGGFVLGGGTGPFGNFYGMGVDNVLQFDIIDATGQPKRVNKCENPDLFWAMKGGGGAFGVTTKVWFRAHPALKAVNIFVGTITCEDSSSYAKVLGEMIDQQVAIRASNHSGIWSASSGTSPKRTMAIMFLRPFFPSDSGPVLAPEETDNVFESILNAPGCTPSVRSVQYEDWNTAYLTSVFGIINAGAPGGISIADNSRLISYDTVSSSSGLQKIKDLVIDAHPESNFIWQNSIGTASASQPKDSTSIHDDWRNSFAFMNLVVNGPWYGVSELQAAVAQGLMDNATQVFGPTSYYNENWKQEKTWQETYWGDKYERLLRIKNEVDPQRLFSCRQCVGSEAGF